MTQWVRLGLLAVIVTTVSGCLSEPRSDLFRPVPSNARVPNSCSSYSFLLFPNFAVSNYYTPAQIGEISERFAQFGSAIGNADCAIMFLDNPHDKTRHNTQRAMYIIDRLNQYSVVPIDYRSSAVIAYSNYNPEEAKPDGGYFTVIQFGGDKPNVVEDEISRLTQLIRERGTAGRALEFDQITMLIRKLISQLSIEFHAGAITIKSR
jgi:hypothetical protein